MTEFRRLIIFAVLMESGQGILSKSPAYVEEKYWKALNVLYPEKLLDVSNLKKFERYMHQWESHLDSKGEPQK